jgi:hypothetical protein
VSGAVLQKYTCGFGRVQEACEAIGLSLAHYKDEQHHALICPFCQGGHEKEPSFSVRVETVPGKGIHAMYNCFRGNKCGVSGRLPGKVVCFLP